MLTAEAIDLLLGCIVYNKISATRVQLKQRAVIVIADMNQKMIWLADLVIKIPINKVGTAISEPKPQTNGSAYGVIFRRYDAAKLDTPTPIKPEMHVITPNIKGILFLKKINKLYI